jgi:hypothetical protein
MRFFEYESRQIVSKAGIDVSAHGFAATAAEARRIAEEIGAPTVITSHVLSGGRMQAGRAGAVLALALLPLEFAFWIGFALPLPPVAGVARTAMIVMAWPGFVRR